MHTRTKETQEEITPLQAFNILKAGNERFINNLKLHRDLLQQVNETKEGQHPIAIVLSCMDSRISNTLMFDQGLGDIFSLRVAGNIINEDMVGSMEYACQVVGAKIIMVLGHTRCGAIKGACSRIQMGNLTPLLEKIRPAFLNTPVTEHDPENPDAFINAVSANNVHHVIDEIPRASPILSELLNQGNIAIVGGMYDVETGKVSFFEHPHLQHFELYNGKVQLAAEMS